jgi:hypothetical protein
LEKNMLTVIDDNLRYAIIGNRSSGVAQLNRANSGGLGPKGKPIEHTLWEPTTLFSESEGFFGWASRGYWRAWIRLI